LWINVEMKETLLIVEDNLALREGLREFLADEGYVVLTATNGREALGQMNTVTPDLIVSDIAMPEMDGVTFFQAVRSQPNWITIPFVFMTARGEKEDILAGKNLGAEDYLVKPLLPEEIVTAVRSRLDRAQQLRMAQLQEAYEASLTVLANAIEVRDPYTRGHIERVTNYSMALAAELGLQGQILEQLRFGSILHDIGKIHVRETTLLKPSALDQDEWKEIKSHPVTGTEMIKDISYLIQAFPVVRYHHERWDGLGYPEGLTGEAIPLAARIVAVADAFDAMTTNRPYSPTRSMECACDEILNCSEKQYDPAVVTAFYMAWESGKIMTIWKSWFANHNNS
jgi:response regulator RpfG family c-di-GMP phosphodiesterase